MRYLLPVVLVLALAACGGSHTASGPSAPSLATTCGTLPGGFRASTTWLTTGDGVRIYAATTGTDDRVVVLAHESGGLGLCGWIPTMRRLAANGIRSVAFDFRGQYPSPLPPRSVEDDWRADVQAAIDYADAKKLVLMGASFGGAVVVADGFRLHGVDGIVSLSGEPAIPSRHVDAIGNVARLRLPLLVVASRLDGYLDEAHARQLARRAGSTDKQVAVFPGRAHGWDILDEPRARSVVVGWITRRLQ
jgi:alpha-beta hydrolase superfamily lysophospholipase